MQSIIIDNIKYNVVSNTAKFSKDDYRQLKNLMLGNREVSGMIDFNINGFENMLVAVYETYASFTPTDMYDYEMVFHTHPLIIFNKEGGFPEGIRIVNPPSLPDIINRDTIKIPNMIIAPEGIYIIKQNKKKIRSKNFEKNYYDFITKIIDSDDSVNIDFRDNLTYFLKIYKGKFKYNIFNILEDYIEILKNLDDFKKENDLESMGHIQKVENILIYINYLIFDIGENENFINKLSKIGKSVEKFINEKGGIDCMYFPYTNDIEFNLPIMESNAPKSNIRLSSHSTTLGKYNYLKKNE